MNPKHRDPAADALSRPFDATDDYVIDAPEAARRAEARAAELRADAALRGGLGAEGVERLCRAAERSSRPTYRELADQIVLDVAFSSDGAVAARAVRLHLAPYPGARRAVLVRAVDAAAREFILAERAGDDEYPLTSSQQRRLLAHARAAPALVREHFAALDGGDGSDEGGARERAAADERVWRAGALRLAREATLRPEHDSRRAFRRGSRA